MIVPVLIIGLVWVAFQVARKVRSSKKDERDFAIVVARSLKRTGNRCGIEESEIDSDIENVLALTRTQAEKELSAVLEDYKERGKAARAEQRDQDRRSHRNHRRPRNPR